MTDYEKGKLEMFQLITSAYYGKQYYFLENEQAKLVYSRKSHNVVPMDDAIKEFLNEVGW